MSNLYYNYRGDNANHRAASTNPSSQNEPQPKNGNSLSVFPSSLHQGIQLPPSTLSSAQQTSTALSSSQAWAADQTIQHQSTSQTNTTQLQPNLVNTSYPSSQTSRTIPNTAMNGTRAAPLGTRRVSQYEDSLFQMMGKGYSQKTPRNNASVSSLSLQPTPQGTIDQYQQMRSGAASNVFDPNDFPSLGGGLGGPQSALASSTAALLGSSSALETSAISGVGAQGSSVNGLSSFENMYSVGGYGDGRAKAVDAVTGASAVSEFSMHSEDFPALGGNAVPGSIPSSVLGNGQSTSNILGTSSKLGAVGTPSEKTSLLDGYLDMNSARGVQQAHSLVGRSNLRLDQAGTGVTLGRATQPQSDYQLYQGRGAPHSLTRNAQAHPDMAVQDTNRSPAKPEFPTRSPPGMVEKDDSSASNGDRKGSENFDILGNRHARQNQGAPAGEAKAIPNGDTSGLSGLPTGTSGARLQGGSSIQTRTTGGQQKDPKNTGIVLPTDQYGMRGLLRYVGEEAEGTDANMLSIGVDLTMLGLDLNSPEPLHKTFANPWEGGQGGLPSTKDTAGSSQKNEEPDYKLPTCYYMQPPALKNSHFTKFQLETLFYVFYNMPRDVLQVLAAIELYNRKWRYHKDLKLWFTCEPEVLQGYERGAYIYFDIKSWEQRPFNDANQSFIQGLMTEEELRSVPIPGQRPAAS